MSRCSADVAKGHATCEPVRVKEPVIGNLDERLADKFAKLGFRAAGPRRAETANGSDDQAGAAGPDTDATLEGVQATLSQFLERLDRLEVAVDELRAMAQEAAVAPPSDSALTATVDTIASTVGALDKQLYEHVARPLDDLTARIAALESLIERLPPARGAGRART